MRTTGIKRLVAMTMAVCVLTGMMPQNVKAEEVAAQTETAVTEETSSQETQSEETQPEETMTPEPATTVSGNEPAVEPSPEPSPTPAATEEPMVGMFRMPDIVRSGDQTPVSRIQWLKELTTTFDMTVEKDNYPDNYYSDIDSSYADYYTVMLATEFGLVDVEAGEAFEPDQAASREFAAHSLNLCMGYINEDDYTFTDQSDAEYADDLQIAVKRGWLELADGKVLPKKALTAEEKDVMITDARDAVASTKIDPDYQNAYTFAEGVIVLPEGTVAELTGENELTLYSCDTELKAGDIFAVVQEDFPVVKKVISVATEEDKMIVQVESVATEEAFQDIDVEGSLSADLTQIQAFSDQVALTYIAGGTQEQNWEDGTEYTDAEEVSPEEITAVRAQLSYDIPEAVRKEYNLAKGMKATIDCVITNVTPDYKISLKEAYFNVSATATFTCNVSLDVLEAIGVAPSIELVRVPVGVVGYMSASLELTLKGNITLTLVENISAGVQYKNGTLRLVSDFHKQAFTIQAQAEASAGIKLAAGFDVVALKGSIYGRLGAKATIQMQTYDDGKTPTRCTHMQAYMYASVGADVKVDLVVWKKSWSKSYEIYGAGNSPVRVAFHYEDGTAVPKCTRDGSEDGNPGSGGGTSPAKKWKYYTPASSRYGYNGASGGVDANGNEYSIFEYSLDDAKNATITKYQGNVSALSIPDALDGYPVVGIAANVFEKNKQLRVVVIPDSVISIGRYAFSECSNLTTVILSKNVTNIGYEVFNNCDKLTSIEIPKSLENTEIGGYSQTGVFRDCDNLKNITFEEGTTRIARGLFANCPGIEQITIPNTVTEIQNLAFYGCKNLQSITIPNSVTSIGSNAFYANTALKEVVISDSVTSINSYAFSECSNLTTVILSKNVTNMGYEVFNNCDKLTSIEIPKSLENTEIGGYSQTGVFRDCDNLKNITFEEGTTRIARGLFANCPGIEQITIPNTVTEIQDLAFYGCKNLQSITIPESVTSIGNRGFTDNVSLQEVMLPNSITDMGTYIFSGCTSLQKVHIPERRKNITEGTFQNCTSLQSIELPDGLQYIRKYAFQGSGLTEITIPDSVIEIEDSAFRECADLSKVTLGERVKTLGQYTFYKCPVLSGIALPDSLTTMGIYCFAECDKLAAVTFGTGLTKVPSYAFNLCQSLKKIELPYRLQTVYANAFTNCTSLTEVTIPRNTSSIAFNAFSYPTKMTVYGITGTYAETYAKSVGAKFVNKEVKATKVQLSETNLSINKGETTTLILTVTPQNFTDEVTWKSSNTNVVTISDAGVVTAKAAGTATIRVTVGSVSASCKVTVLQPVTSISLNKSSLTLEGGDSFTLVASVYPSDAYNKQVKWSTSDERVASIDQQGNVTATGKGKATITAMAADGSGVYRNCTITVNSTTTKVTDISKFASAHPYENNCSDSWIYTKQGASALEVTFSKETEVEDEFDFLYIYDQNGKEIGKYTGTGLAGQSITVKGNTVKVKLVSDGQGTAYGFRVTQVKEVAESTPTQPVEEKFTDVQSGAWYVSAVQYAYDNGIMGGKSETVFAPEANLTRAEFGTVLYSQSGKPAVTYRPVFKDVEKGAWYSSPVLWAYDNGIVSGYANGNFGTSDNITREQLALMMYKYAKTKGYDTTAESGMLQKFSDEAQISTWAREAIQWAASHGIMSGKGNGADGKPLLDPQGNATRAECAAMMKKMLTMN